MMLTDSSGRPLTYLRISVTPECGLRCLYCRPACAEGAAAEDWSWSISDLEKLARAAVAEGLTHLRLTGGEPLERPDLPLLIGRLAQVPGLTDLGLTTNGQALEGLAPELFAAGLRRVNISLDSLDAATFATLTGGGSLDATWRGVMAAVAAGMDPIKLNVVLLRGYNDTEVPHFAALARDHGLHVRFIELMPIGLAAGHEALFYPASAALEQLAGAGLGAETSSGPGPARVWELGPGTVGVITPITAPTCASCNRLRVTARGFLRPCLTDATELDLRPALADPQPEAALRQAIREAVALKPARGSHLDGNRLPTLTMSQVGG